MSRSFNAFAKGNIIPKNLTASADNNTPIRPESLSGHFTDPKYQLDANRNGIIDGNELIANGDILLESPYPMYAYGSTVPLDAYLMRDGYLIDIDSSSRVHFEVTKVLAYSGSTDDLANATIIYDSGSTDTTLHDSSKIDRYVSFNPAKVTAVHGRAAYSLSAKNKDADVTVVASIITLDKDGKVFVNKQSSPSTIAIRGTHISVMPTIQTASGSQIVTSVTAVTGANQFALAYLDALNRPITSAPSPDYTLRVFNDVTNDQVA